MTLQQLYYAITIAETGALSRAAEVLYISQPSLSNTVQELERELGFALFRRSGHGMTPTCDGVEFLSYARQIYHQYETLLERYGKTGKRKKKFGISAQHYSFAGKSFVEMVKQFNTAEYEFAIRETKTHEVIDDVRTGKSEIGILYLSNFNRKILSNLLKTNDLTFHRLIKCGAYVYLWKGHPLAGCDTIRFEQLSDYPCLSFEQGSEGSFYFAEEILSTEDYPRTIKANDFLAIPFASEGDPSAGRMEIGYIVKKNLILSRMGELYIEEIRRYLGAFGDID